MLCIVLESVGDWAEQYKDSLQNGQSIDWKKRVIKRPKISKEGISYRPTLKRSDESFIINRGNQKQVKSCLYWLPKGEDTKINWVLIQNSFLRAFIHHKQRKVSVWLNNETRVIVNSVLILWKLIINVFTCFSFLYPEYAADEVSLVTRAHFYTVLFKTLKELSNINRNWIIKLLFEFFSVNLFFNWFNLLLSWLLTYILSFFLRRIKKIGYFSNWPEFGIIKLINHLRNASLKPPLVFFGKFIIQ